MTLWWLNLISPIFLVHNGKALLFHRAISLINTKTPNINGFQMELTNYDGVLTSSLQFHCKLSAASRLRTVTAAPSVDRDKITGELLLINHNQNPLLNLRQQSRFASCDCQIIQQTFIARTYGRLVELKPGPKSQPELLFTLYYISIIIIFIIYLFIYWQRSNHCSLQTENKGRGQPFK